MYTELWLITDFHQNGSLFDYLKGRTNTIFDAILLASSAAEGIDHLHKIINGNKTKLGVAHRDIKTRNILVKDDGQCAIADFGLAVTYDPQANKVHAPGLK